MKTMRTLLMIAVLGVLLFPLQGCHDDDGITVPAAVEEVFKNKYPEADRVEWERKGIYYVADFFRNNYEASAWFSGEIWQMTEFDVVWEELPQAVKTAFSASEYKDWRIEDIDKVERLNMETLYVIEVESGKQEYDLYYSEAGLLIKAVPDDDPAGDYIPVELTEKIREFLATRYPAATLLDVEAEKGKIEVDILDGTVHREVVFETSGEWAYTLTELYILNDIPAAIRDALYAAGYHSLNNIDDMHYVETPTGNYYHFEFETGAGEKNVLVSEEGTVTEL